MKNTIFCAISGNSAYLFYYLFGKNKLPITTLIIFMLCDYITGIICAGVFKKSDKTDDGGLSSKVGFKGLLKKFLIFILIIISYRLDVLLNTSYVELFVIYSFIVNEGLSIIENMVLIGIPVPTVIKKALSIVRGKTEDDRN